MDPAVYLNQIVIPAAYRLLPARMNSPAATAELLAIALQESRAVHRVQHGGGPAHGLWQFEKNGGVAEVLSNRTSPLLVTLCRDVFRIAPTRDAVHQTIAQDNVVADILAAVCARLLLYTVPGKLPERDQPELGWAQYYAAWRPGQPHRDTWDGYYQRAWFIVESAL